MESILFFLLHIIENKKYSKERSPLIENEVFKNMINKLGSVQQFSFHIFLRDKY